MSYINQGIKPINTIRNEKGNVEISGCDIVELANKFSTPLYVIDEITLTKMAQDYINAFSEYKKTNMMFASKALMTSSIAKILSNQGFGFDVVSIGEIYTLLNAGIKLDNVSFNGNNKSPEELEFALENNIKRVSVDNFYELELLNKIAKDKNRIQEIHLRITPGIECHTHEYIQTGQLDSKFGFDLNTIDLAIEKIKNEYKNLELKGLHAHIGSQIFETQVYYDLITILLNEIKRINDKFNLNLSEINAGGGLGVTYTKEDTPPSVYQIASVIIKSIKENCKKLNLEEPILMIEPGRSLVSTAGFSLYTIGSTKNIPNIRRYVAINGGMSDNPRPSMYQAKYSVIAPEKMNDEKTEKYSIAGKCCESGDLIAENVYLPKMNKGDLLAVLTTGAYNYSMASNYNRNLVPQVIKVKNGKAEVMVKGQTIEDLLKNDL